MNKIKLTNYVLVFILIVSIFAIVNLKTTTGNSKTQNNTKYLIVKIDDFGYGNWIPVLLAFQNNPNFVADIGVIGYNLKIDIINQLILTELFATGRIDIFNHGWDHSIPEFQNHSVDYMISHINLWNKFMYQIYGLKNEFILGAPGNSFGDTHNCSEPIYQAMKETGYKVLFFSFCSGSTNDGNAGLNIPYLYVENDCADGCQYGPINDSALLQGIQDLATYQTIYIQVHFTLGDYWNYATITNFLNFMYKNSGRVGITTTDYYNQIFLPSHPNYFLRNATNQIINLDPNSRILTSIFNIQNDLRIEILISGSLISTNVIVLFVIKKINPKSLRNL